MPTRYTRAADVPHLPTRVICSEPAIGGNTLYTFQDGRGDVIGYVTIRLAPVEGAIPRQVVELYDLCLADAIAHSLRMG